MALFPHGQFDDAFSKKIRCADYGLFVADTLIIHHNRTIRDGSAGFTV